MGSSSLALTTEVQDFKMQLQSKDDDSGGGWTKKNQVGCQLEAWQIKKTDNKILVEGVQYW